MPPNDLGHIKTVEEVQISPKEKENLELAEECFDLS
jgi:hypothetical protein